MKPFVREQQNLLQILYRNRIQKHTFDVPDGHQTIFQSHFKPILQLRNIGIKICGRRYRCNSKCSSEEVS